METPALLPPKVSESGHQAFAASEQESLARCLQEPAWPRGTLNIYALEGYLTALLVWPVALQPGAWLPPIWNEEGWKVRPPIDTVPRYGEFVELVLGYLRRIDRGLLQTPSVFEPSLHLPFSIDLTHAVLALADTRISRGPLGALPKKTVTARPADLQIHESAGPLKDGSS